jgi:hypothetical protein
MTDPDPRVKALRREEVAMLSGVSHDTTHSLTKDHR